MLLQMRAIHNTFCEIRQYKSHMLVISALKRTTYQMISFGVLDNKNKLMYCYTMYAAACTSMLHICASQSQSYILFLAHQSSPHSSLRCNVLGMTLREHFTVTLFSFGAVFVMLLATTCMCASYVTWNDFMLSYDSIGTVQGAMEDVC